MSWGKNDQDLLRKTKEAIENIRLDNKVTAEVKFKTTLSNSDEEMHRHTVLAVLNGIISSRPHDAHISIVGDVGLAMMYADEVEQQIVERRLAKLKKKEEERRAKFENANV